LNELASVRGKLYIFLLANDRASSATVSVFKRENRVMNSMNSLALRFPLHIQARDLRHLHSHLGIAELFKNPEASTVRSYLREGEFEVV